MGATIPIAICAIMIATAGNVVAYGRMTDVRREIAAERKALDAARTENADLKKRWYEALDADNLKDLVGEYGFVKIAAPEYLPS